MGFGAIISGIFAIAKVIPIVDSWIQQLVVAYTTTKLASMKKENADAIRTAFTLHDQRDLEKAVGNSHAGEASGDAGAEIVDAPPPNVSQGNS